MRYPVGRLRVELAELARGVYLRKVPPPIGMDPLPNGCAVESGTDAHIRATRNGGKHAETRAEFVEAP